MITTNDIENAKQKCYSIYQDLQATLAGQSMTDVEHLRISSMKSVLSLD